MKKTFLLLLSFAFVFAASTQVVKRLGDRVKQKMENKAGEKIDKSIDDAVDGQAKKDKKNTVEENEAEPSKNDNADKSASIKTYGKYDFVPGNNIIFEDNLQSETDGEFPSLYNTTQGQAQVSLIQGEKVIQSLGCSDLIPRIKNGKPGTDYLPEQFTIEYDAYFAKEWGKGWWWTALKFYDATDPQYYEYSEGVGDELTIDQQSAKYQSFSSEVPADLVHGGWNHVAIAVNKNLLKVYLNQTRLINNPSFKGNPRAVTFMLSPNGCDKEAVVAIRNIRIASGGIDLYKRATVEGKFVARGINFDYNKAVLLPQSMGDINRIYQLMKDNPELKFEIGGHTDSDGDDAYNLKLSQQRADAVKEQLVKMGIDASRLTTKGYGETKPLTDNTTPEGKANNRRVELVRAR